MVTAAPPAVTMSSNEDCEIFFLVEKKYIKFLIGSTIPPSVATLSAPASAQQLF